MNNVLVEVKIKEHSSGHYVKTDCFKGNPEQVVDTLLRKYIGQTSYERLGSLILNEIKNG